MFDGMLIASSAVLFLNAPAGISVKLAFVLKTKLSDDEQFSNADSPSETNEFGKLIASSEILSINAL